MRKPPKTYLVKGNFNLFDVEVFKEHGHIASALYCLLADILEDNFDTKTFLNEDYHVLMCETPMQLQQYMSYASVDQIVDAFEGLEEAGIIVVVMDRKRKWNTLWYTLTPKLWVGYTEDEEESS